MADSTAGSTAGPEELAPRLRAHLRAIAGSAAPVTYQALARDMGLAPPHSIHRLTQALERLMREDAARGHPFIAALVVSKARPGVPAPGFFACARALGRYDGDEAGAQAQAFHAAELAAAAAFWEDPAREGPARL